MVSASQFFCLLAGFTGGSAMQMVARPTASKLKAEQPVSTPAACSPLRNFGTYSTVRVEVGTPPQPFDLVADTGSNSVIVLSCACVGEGNCPEGESPHCFQGTGRSSTFQVTKDAQGDISMTTLSFGSGDIQTVLASDIVSVGGSKTTMENGLLLMVDKQLDFGGAFEGILGLGIPQMEGSSLYEPGMIIPEYLVSSKISSFSMCFNDGADGALRLNIAPQSGKSLGSVGSQHWGLGFNGISIGNTKDLAAHICSRDDMQEGQVTPCGAIPDSGTTAISAPKKALQPLLDGICDGWLRCSQLAATADLPKSYVLIQLLEDCEDWLTEEEGLDELPKLTFHLTGANGDEELVKINGWSYVLETTEDELVEARESLVGLFSLPIGAINPQDGARKVCVPAFQAMEMSTATNGDVWILGTPFFYQYDVHYDLAKAPPAMTFAPSACGSCDTNSSLFTTGRSDHATRSPRKVAGAWRRPSKNVSQGL